MNLYVVFSDVWNPSAVSSSSNPESRSSSRKLRRITLSLSCTGEFWWPTRTTRTRSGSSCHADNWSASSKRPENDVTILKRPQHERLQVKFSPQDSDHNICLVASLNVCCSFKSLQAMAGYIIKVEIKDKSHKSTHTFNKKTQSKFQNTKRVSQRHSVDKKFEISQSWYGFSWCQLSHRIGIGFHYQMSQACGTQKFWN